MAPSRKEAHLKNRTMKPSHASLWVVGAAVVLALSGVALSMPRAAVAPSSDGLVRISWKSVFGRVNRASFHTAGAEVPLVDNHGVLSPASRAASGVSGVVRVTIAGPSLLSWVPWDHRQISVPATTPLSPKVTTTQVTRLLAGPVEVQFAHPVAKVSYAYAGQMHTLTLDRPKKTVVLALPKASPGTHGTLSVAASARLWENPGRSESLNWATIPALTLDPSTTLPIQPNASLTVDFSQPLVHTDLSQWKVLPRTPGHWTEENASTYSFTPSNTSGFGPGALVAVEIPGGSSGPFATNGSYLNHPAKLEWTTPDGSILRLQQLLAQEGYLPVSWTPAEKDGPRTVSTEDQTIYQPRAGHFTWKYPNLPKVLHTLWTPGQMSVMTKGAIMQFERVNGLAVDGIAGPEVWSALIRDRVQGRVSPDQYTYISVTETQPETLELWVDNHIKLTTVVNTGISATPTYLGTYAVYERLPFQIMRGSNPNGVPYADPVHWINYFAGSDAVHGFYRAAYGFPQSLGCVEMPLNIASTVYHTVHYGTLVTINPVGVARAPAHPIAAATAADQKAS